VATLSAAEARAKEATLKTIAEDSATRKNPDLTRRDEIES
jgi:hypothetical protein